MHAEIIAIGDEITSGQLLDTNSQWLSQRLAEMGIRVLYHTTVGDELAAEADVFKQAIDRSDLVITTGGLGPTADDLTREALARATGKPLKTDREALEHIRQLYARRQRQMPKRNELQATFPLGAEMVPNPNGTAPGIAMQVARPGKSPCQVYCLPGVPSEMREMWYGTLAEAVRKFGGGQEVIRHRRIKIFGRGESRIEAMLPDLVRRGREPRVGINASKHTIILRISASGPTEEACYAAIEPTVATIHDCLGPLVFGEGDDELQHALVRLLRQEDRTLATAECDTGGLVADWLGDVREGRGWYLGGFISAAQQGLSQALNVPPELIAEHTAASKPVVAAMAAHCRRMFQADLGLAAGVFPDYDAEADEPEPFWMALATADGVIARRVPFAGNPGLLKIYCAKHTINLARLFLMGALGADAEQ
jgi:nicotinamide-nucleotide amidase